MASGAGPSGYTGDLNAAEAWALLAREPKAQLVDVRTAAEWTFVGVPDLTEVDRKPVCVEWQTFPSMVQNPEFAARVDAAVGNRKDVPVLFLCRTGARSKAAAAAMTANGYTQAYNIAGGFEGDLDAKNHRGTTTGWKAAGLPWIQT